MLVQRPGLSPRALSTEESLYVKNVSTTAGPVSPSSQHGGVSMLRMLVQRPGLSPRALSTEESLYVKNEPILIKQHQSTTYKDQTTEDTAVMETLSIFKNVIPNREQKSLISKTQIHPIHEDIVHEDRPIKKKDKAEIAIIDIAEPNDVDDKNAVIHGDNNEIVDKFEVNDTKMNVAEDFVPNVFAFNALFLDPSKVEMKQNEIAHDSSLFLKRLNPRQDPIEDLDIGKNLLENIMEVGMSTARAAIHLGRAYKNTKNILNQITNKEQQAANIQNQMSRNIDGNTHALNHLQTSFDSTQGVASNGSFYTELDCVWLLYCRNLAATTKLNAPCSKVNAASVVLDTIMQSHRKSQVSNRGR
ncbi:hypothetical protein HF086_017261 [Spodoptera exigua]|uniref:Uncharacterized protein n=1 Tax=Spodoptera exigua TaxID=7107 RepID=A0A922M0E2_SPOEX|nr:hypothetical protein HF086_017261 [Spodoptera exigua]